MPGTKFSFLRICHKNWIKISLSVKGQNKPTGWLWFCIFLYPKPSFQFKYKLENKLVNVLNTEQEQPSPDRFNTHYGLAGTYLRQKRLEEALQELKIVIELAPDSVEAKYARNIMQKISQQKLKIQSEDTKEDKDN